MKSPKELIKEYKDKKIVFNLIDYKGKHFIIQDQNKEQDEMNYMDIIIGTITKQEAMNPTYSRNHIENCTYYGIPAYIGDDEDMQARYEAEIHLPDCICEDCQNVEFVEVADVEEEDDSNYY